MTDNTGGKEQVRLSNLGYKVDGSAAGVEALS